MNETPIEALFILFFLILALASTVYWIWSSRDRKMDKDITNDLFGPRV